MADKLFYKIMEDFKSSPIVNKNKKEDVIIEEDESPGNDVKPGHSDLQLNIVVISRVENSDLMFVFEIDQIFINYS